MSTVCACGLMGGKGMFCRKCGKEIDDNALFCTGCGARVQEDGLLVGEFECFYDEISEVSCMLGCVQIRANGKLIVIPGLDDRETAKQMIEQRISKH